ncbi:MAG TPA: hypothetical protein VNS09_08480 [Solirubrobacter sp.]|nr:hypothetical protein [Solirubrobacter sp.]
MGWIRFLLPFVLLTAWPAAAAAQVTPVPGLSGPADSIVAGPDGALWAATDDVARITPAGEVTYPAVLPPGAQPSGLTVAAGTLWVRTATGFGSLTPAFTAFTLLSGVPTSLAAGADGALWLAVPGGVTRFTPLLQTPFAAGTAPRSLTAGPDGALWFVDDGNGWIGRITTDGDVTFRSVGAAPSALAGGPLDSLWYAQGATVRRLGDPGTVYTLPAPANALAAGPDGALWAAVPGGAVRIVPGAEPAMIAVGADGLAITAGPDQNMWMTLDRAPYLVRIAVPAPAPAPPPAEPPPPAPTPTPGPVQGRSVAVRVAAGTVSYRIPPSTRYVKLAGAATLPLGALFDTTHGKLTLTSAVGGKLQTGTFHGGKFIVTQTRTGMTELALAGPLACGARTLFAAKPKRKKKKRLVWGKESGGSFRTRGSSSVATVRGTEWRTEDTCAGTTVYVRRGAVSVWPRAGGRSKLIRAGHRYLTPRR